MRIKSNRITWNDASRLYDLESKDIVVVLESNGVEVKNISTAGSLRRKRKTIGDLDIVIEVDNPCLAGKILEDKMNYQFFSKGSFYKGGCRGNGALNIKWDIEKKQSFIKAKIQHPPLDIEKYRGIDIFSFDIHENI